MLTVVIALHKAIRFKALRYLYRDMYDIINVLYSFVVLAITRMYIQVNTLYTYVYLKKKSFFNFSL